jgi:DNA-binding transcriptional ArsR family regulator
MSNQAEVQDDGRAGMALDALGDPTRRQIVQVLRDGPTSVGALAEQLPVRRPAVSKHLKVLEGAGLVTHRSVGTSNLYALAPDGLHEVQQWLLEQWGTALDAFARHVERNAP